MGDKRYSATNVISDTHNKTKNITTNKRHKATDIISDKPRNATNVIK